MTDLDALLERAADGAVPPTGYRELARRGARRRVTRRVALASGTALAVAVVIAGMLRALPGVSIGEPAGHGDSGSLPTELAWEHVEDAPLTPRRDPVLVSSSRYVVVAGGTDPASGATLTDAALLDVVTRRWRLLPAATEPIRPSIADLQLTNDHLAVLDDGLLQVLSLADSRWEVAGPIEPVGAEAMGTPRLHLSSRFAVVTGSQGDRLAVRAWDLAARRWADVADAPAGTADAGVLLDADALIVAGGGFGSGDGAQLSGEVRRLDLTTGVWTDLPPLPTAAGFHVMLGMRGGLLVALGGYLDRDAVEPSGPEVPIPPYEVADPVVVDVSDCEDGEPCRLSVDTTAEAGPQEVDMRAGVGAVVLEDGAWHAARTGVGDSLTNPRLVDGWLYFGYHPWSMLVDPITGEQRSVDGLPRPTAPGAVVAGRLLRLPRSWAAADPAEPDPEELVMLSGPLVEVGDGMRLSRVEATAPHARVGSRHVVAGGYLLTFGGSDAETGWHVDGWLLRLG